MIDVFINYRSADARFGAAAAFELLAGRFGRSRVFLDNQSMEPGALYPESIRSALRSMRVLVVLIGPEWLSQPALIHRQGDWVRREIKEAVRRDIPIVPVLLDGAALPDPNQLPVDVRPLVLHQSAEVRHRTLGADVELLARHLARFLPELSGFNAPTPRQIPASPHLVGREDELSRLDHSLRGAADGRPRIAVLSGTAGVGKTALASRWAHHAAADFPDGQLYIDLRGFGPGEPVAPMAALSSILRALGVARPEELTDLAERSARFRTLMSGRRAVVLLDNAHSAAQIEPLLPGSGPAVVLVTSRDVLGALRVRHTATLLRLAPLTTSASVRLVVAGAGERAKREPRAVVRLAEQCNGLPLALRIVVERLVSHVTTPIAALVTELDSERERLAALSRLGSDANVRTVFSWSYRRIDGDRAAVFRAIGLGPGRSFEAQTVAALAQRPVDVVERALSDLERAHLVTDLGNGRYAMHDLLFLYAGEVAASGGDPAPVEAPRRLFDHYLQSAARAGRLITPHRTGIPLVGDPVAGRDFSDVSAAKSWLEAEEPNLIALCRSDNPALDEYRWQLAFVLRDYFYLTKRIDAWMETHTAALVAARRSGNTLAEATTRNNLGMAMTARGLLEEAMVEFTAAKSMFATLGDVIGESNSLANVASVLRRQGNPRGALSHLSTALACYRRTWSPTRVGITLRSMAKAHIQLAQAAEAVDCAQEAVDFATWMEYPLDIAQANNILGVAYWLLGDPVLAEIAHRQALEMGERCDSEFEQAWAYRGLGRVELMRDSQAAAVSYWRDAWARFQKIGSPHSEDVAGGIGRLTVERAVPQSSDGGADCW